MATQTFQTEILRKNYENIQNNKTILKDIPYTSCEYQKGKKEKKEKKILK